jgi:hypothetical protein
MRWHRSRLTNVATEGTDLVIKSIERLGFGFRDTDGTATPKGTPNCLIDRRGLPRRPNRVGSDLSFLHRRGSAHGRDRCRHDGTRRFS